MLTSAFLKKQAESSPFWQGAELYNRCLQSVVMAPESMAPESMAAESMAAESMEQLQRPPVSASESSAENAAERLLNMPLYGSAIPNPPTFTYEYPHSIDFLYRYGYEFLGMAYSVYIHRVIDKIQQFGIDRVMFVAREGYLFQKIYEILTDRMAGAVSGAVSGAVTTHYTYLSEASTFLPSVSHLSTRELVLSTDKSGQLGLWRTLKKLGLPLAEFESFAQAHGIDVRSPIHDYWNDQRLLRFLSDQRVQSCVKDHQQRAHAKLAQYLTQAGFFGQNQKVALVNIGWDGTIQDNLVRAFSQRSDFPLLYGLYFGLRERQTFLKYSSSFSQGLIYDSRNRNINAESTELFVEIFEKGASAPHPETVGYESRSKRFADGVRPVFSSENSPSRQAELKSNGAIAVMQRGILDFAHQYGQQWQQQNFSAEANLPFVHGLITRHIAFPTHEEAFRVATQLSSPPETLQGQQAQHLGEDKIVSFAVTAKAFWRPLIAGRFTTALSRLKESVWHAGSFRLMKIPGLISLYRIKRFLSF